MLKVTMVFLTIALLCLFWDGAGENKKKEKKKKREKCALFLSEKWK